MIEYLSTILILKLPTYEFKRGFGFATGCLRQCIFLVTHDALKYSNGLEGFRHIGSLSILLTRQLMTTF